MGGAETAGAHRDRLNVCRRAAERVRAAIAGVDDRARELGQGEGGDTTLAVDAAAEEAILAELTATGEGLTVVSEEQGEVDLNGGGPPFAIVDPVDGSLNAKRGLPFFSISVAFSPTREIDAVDFGYVADLTAGTEWHAARGGGAWRGADPLPPLQPGPLEVLGLETVRPGLLVDQAEAIAAADAKRVRVLGSVALSLCFVADGRFDAMLSLRDVRSVDMAAGALIVREAGGTVAFAAGSIDLDARARVFAARDAALLAAF